MLERECASLPHVNDKENHRRKRRRRSASQASNGTSTSTTKPPQLHAIKSQEAISWNAHHARISLFPRRRRRRTRSSSHQRKEQKHSMNCRKKNKKKRQRPGSIDLNTHKQPTQLRKAAKQVLFRKSKSSSSIRCVWFTDRIEIEITYKITKAAEGKGKVHSRARLPTRPRAQQASPSALCRQDAFVVTPAEVVRRSSSTSDTSIHTHRPDSGTELN